MLTAGTVWAALVTYVFMLAAFRYAKQRTFHVLIMTSVILFDLGMPIYLYLYKDWYRRLIVENELTSFLVWIHFMMLVMMYALYVMQVKTALCLLRSDNSVRIDHRAQGKALLLVRALVIFTGALLVES
ncbi:hypothetical protein [Candidatus Nitrotoga sp. AM1P]|uniref:hypothetical protein n=1 Tax=Candidatus Nitrotoga sp. AM1P TaxID=2559597 RepID=UPI0010BAD5A2|nr:hypothetical protein [Candidatus Nitrotoga sp. AM1P]BBJ23993.1 hypothetical protein W01_19200 [Candidatus Nitrotoga sp. AM1P]